MMGAASRYEFSSKNFSVNPYDGHTLNAQMKQIEQMVGERVEQVHLDMGYRGHDYLGEATVHVDKRTRGRTPRPLWRWMERNRLKGTYGNAINSLLSAAAMNFHKLLGAFCTIFCFLCCACMSGYSSRGPFMASGGETK
jgi:transposase, IS5 family